MKIYYQFFVSLIVASGIAISISSCSSSDTNSNQPPSNSVDLAELKIQLGRMIFHDENLSEPVGQSCSSCHLNSSGFSDPDVTNMSPVSEGAVTGRFGNRNAPTAGYAAFTPDFSFDSIDNSYSGGQFLDGRANNLTEQAKGPFLNPMEMANADEAMVIEKIRNAPYATMFKQVYGADSLSNVSTAFNNMAEAIAAFESIDEFSPFSSKFDAFLAGTTTLTEQEIRGLDLFENKGLCTECHTIQPGNQPLFTDFSYRNIGSPANPFNPVYQQDAEYIDEGLAENPNLVSDVSLERGKFRVPTLRNVENTAPYMHNGSMQTLEQVVNFYNTRDSNQCYGANAEPFVNCWPLAEVETNMDISSVGDLLLTDIEEADLVAFLKTLTDGYQ